METNNTISSGGSIPQSGSLESEQIQEASIFSPDSESIGSGPEMDASIELPQGEADARGIMDIPGTPHKKLESLANLDEDIEEPDVEGEPIPNNPDLEEFIKKLKKLLEEAEESRI